MKSKVIANMVRKAAKRQNLIVRDCCWYDKQEGASCPLGTLAIDAANNKGEFVSDDSKLENWAERKFGKYYVEGFISSFDGLTFIEDALYDMDYIEDIYDEDDSEIIGKKYKIRKRDREFFKQGFNEGKRLRKVFLE